ncbi:hypothetical protein ACFLWU_03500 [Chloroflexota bacterium]
MDKSKYGKYFVSNPKLRYTLGGHNIGTKIEGMTPAQVFLDKDIMPGCPVWVDVVWIYDNVTPSPWVFAHKHDVDEVLVFLATNGEGDLGGEIELAMGEEGEIHKIHQNTTVYIPRGVTHCPLTVKSVDKNKPQLFLAFLLQSEYKSSLNK